MSILAHRCFSVLFFLAMFNRLENFVRSLSTFQRMGHKSETTKEMQQEVAKIWCVKQRIKKYNKSLAIQTQFCKIQIITFNWGYASYKICITFLLHFLTPPLPLRPYLHACSPGVRLTKPEKIEFVRLPLRQWMRPIRNGCLSL